MPKEEIVTALQNALERGENLEQAKQVLIFSGYPQKDVEEASHYFVSTPINLQPQIGEELAMPSKKPLVPFFSNRQQPAYAQAQPQQMQKPIQPSQQPILQQSQQSFQQIPQSSQNIRAIQNAITEPMPPAPDYNQFNDYSSKPITQQLREMQPKNTRKRNIIILSIVLLILIGALVGLVLFKDKIFSILGI